MLRAYDVLYYTLENVVHAPKLNIMENEAYTALNRLMQKRRTVLQLAPPHSHTSNT